MNAIETNKLRGCDCLSKLEKQLEKTYGTGNYDLHLNAFICTDPEADNWETYTDFPPLTFKYKDGKKMKSGHFNLRFCPMCGKPRS